MAASISDDELDRVAHARGIGYSSPLDNNDELTDEDAEEDFQLDVEARISRLPDIDLTNLALDGDELPGSVELAARRLLGAVIREALREWRMRLSADALTVVEYVRETIEEEVRHERS